MGFGMLPESWPEMPASSAIGESAPDFELRDTRNRLIRLSDLRGRPVVLAFLRGFL
jgi:peroxiredoxin